MHSIEFYVKLCIQVMHLFLIQFKSYAFSLKVMHSSYAFNLKSCYQIMH